jgi:aminoglycoside phosphotransferase (APT) family kinase protein
MLEQHEVAAYLVKRRLVSRRSIVDGSLRVADASSRNRNFRVSGGRPGESYLLKQGIVSDSAQSLDNEAALYRRLAAGPPRLTACVPRLVRHDDARGLLVLEWIDGGEDLYRVRGARDALPVTLARSLGRLLAAVHRVAPDREELRRDPPWVLSLHRPRLDALRYLTPASIELIRGLQADAGFTRALDALRGGWRVEALVHRDVKWANCVAHAPAGGTRRTHVKLVDWEMAGWGDPALDVGSAFGEFLGFGRQPLATEQPAIAAFWRAYVRARGLDDAGAEVLLERAARFAAARLLQSAYEKTQETGVATARVARRLELSRLIMFAGPAGARDLLGITP